MDKQKKTLLIGTLLGICVIIGAGILYNALSKGSTSNFVSVLLISRILSNEYTAK